ncbi:MAG TPA: TerC family protein [Albitalea sp.]|nr:TerC family protein [Albitalea sp.]
MDITSAAFWVALGSIIFTNVILSGDNAVVIALAARSLRPEQQGKAIFWGSAAAIVLRIILTLVAVQLLQLPYLKIVGALLLFYIGIQLLIEEEEDIEEGKEPERKSMLSAVRTILIADLVMSLDNVIAVAAAAKDSVTLLIIGLGISIPLIIFGSTLLLKLMERFPIIITLGGALLGYLAGEMLVTDPAVITWYGPVSHTLAMIAGALGAVSVVLAGMLIRRRNQQGAAA